MKIEKVLEKDGLYVGTTAGTSMYPMLRNRRDMIVIEPCRERLKKYEVALYRRKEAYVLHRVLEVKTGSYVIRGDNCFRKEYGITDEQIIGKLTEFYRGNRKISLDSLGYKAYARVWCLIYPFRYVLWIGKRSLRMCFRIMQRRTTDEK